MKGVIAKIFGVQLGEEKKIAIFALLGFLWSVAATLGVKFSDALFLLHIGASSFPKVYIGISCSMMILSSAMISFYFRYCATQVFLKILLTGLFCYSLILICLITNTGVQTNWLWYAMRVCASLFFYTSLTSFWTFVDQFHSRADAKRLFGLFTALIFLGNASTGLILRSGSLNIQCAISFIMVILTLTILCARYIINHQEKVTEDISERNTSNVPTSFSIFASLNAVLKTKYTRLIIAGNFLAFLLWIITEYCYMSAFELRFGEVEEPLFGTEHASPLTLFLGKVSSYTSIMNLIFGLFIYGRLVKRFGVGSLILCPPLLYSLNFFGWLFHDGLLFPVFGFFIVEGMTEIMENSNFNILIKTVPSQLKAISRVIIQSIFEPMGMLTSAMLLSIPNIDTKLLGLCLGLCALFVAFSMRFSFFKKEASPVAA